MTEEERLSYLIAENGILGRIYDIEKSLEIIKAWILYGRMEKSKEGKCGIISEETCYMAHDSAKSIKNNGEGV